MSPSTGDPAHSEPVSRSNLLTYGAGRTYIPTGAGEIHCQRPDRRVRDFAAA
jgi:hypothetical protein